VAFGEIVAARELGALLAHPVFQIGDQWRAELLPENPALPGALAIDRLYVLILAMIASGWLMVSASPLPIPIHLPLGFTLPNLTGPNAHIEARAKFTHEVLSKLVIGVIALHVTGALKHHFIDHDGVLSRMLPCGAGIARRRI
jgi:cytochrome b